jgi:hypothetical protein
MIFLPLEYEACNTQIDYYIHWSKYNENDKVSFEEVSEILKQGE